MTEPLPGSIHFGKVVGRVVYLEADTPDDADALPQARAALGRVTFIPQVVLTRVLDPGQAALVIASRANALLSPRGYIMDAEGRDGIWLALGVYKVQFEITGSSRIIPDFEIEVTEAHTADTPLDLAAVSPVSPPAASVLQTLPLPPGGTPGQLLTRASDGKLEWAKLVMSPTRPTSPAPGTVWIDTSF